MNHQLLAETFIFVIVNLNGNLKRLNGNDSMNVVLKLPHRVMACWVFNITSSGMRRTNSLIILIANVKHGLK